MNEYEIMLLLDAELAEERANEVIQRIRDAVEGASGKWDGHEPWGRRRLAYEIDKKPEGIYAVVTLNAEPATVKELDRQLTLNESVLRTKVIRPGIR